MFSIETLIIINMNRPSICCLILLCLINTILAQNFGTACSIYCRACNTSKGTGGIAQYGSCIAASGQLCPTQFVSTGDTDLGYPNCTADPDVYGYISQLAYDDFTFDPDGAGNNCSDFGNYGTTKGFYNHNMALSIVKDTITVDPHYRARLLIGILFINSWNDADNITFAMTPNISVRMQRGSTGSVASVSNIGQLCNSTPNQRYAKYDTGNLVHYATNFNLTATATKCNNCNSGCNCYWMVTDLLLALKLCDPSCAKCTGPTNTVCSQCATDYLLSGSTCSQTCLNGYYQNTTTTPHSCNLCDFSCKTCSGINTNCTTCNTNYVLFLNNSTYNTCLTSCPSSGYYYSSDLGYCDACNQDCKTCTANPSPCQSCNNGFYLFQSQCGSTCPASYFADDSTNKCEDCTVYCVNMTLSRFIASGSSSSSPLMFDLNFTYNIDWTNFTIPDFQSLVFGGSFSLQNFNVTYTNTSSKAFRIIIVPHSYAFLINQSVSITVRSRPDNFNYTSDDLRPFMDAVFNQTLSVMWNYLKAPSMSNTQISIVSTISSYSTLMNNALATPGVQELKKFGFFFLMLNSLQITSCLVLLNSVLPQNLYEGIRFFASFIFFDVPPWQQQSSNSKFVVSAPIVTLPSRRLLSIYVDEFSFRRTGFSGVFLYDAYSQILLIACCYAALGLCLLIAKYWKRANKAKKFVLKCLDAFHQISVMYFTLTIVFEITYFNFSGIKWASIIICFIVNFYYLLYQIKVYYSLLDFPSIPLNDPRFEQYIIRYSFYLKNIRFDEDKVYAGEWGIWKLWFRPHNYHILSYIKKFMMMLTFPIFYYFGYAQIVALIVIQFMEIVRFVFTWPYRQRWRNIFRLTLEGILLGIFGLILFIEMIVVFMTSGTIQSSETWAAFFFVMGWITFALICIYNISFLVLFCFNWYQDCNYTNRQIMQKSRRDYYFQKLKQHEQNNDVVPVQVVNQCVKKGNLNKRKMKELPEVLERIEYYGISFVQSSSQYNLEVKVITELAMGTEYNYSCLHNLVANKMIQTSGTIDSENILYKSIHSMYQKYKRKFISHIVCKTFLEVDQKKYKFNEIIPIELSKLSQQIQIHYLNRHQPEIVHLNKPSAGFPISHAHLEIGLYLREELF